MLVSCPRGGREGEGPLCRPPKPPVGPEPRGPRSPSQWTSASCQSWASNEAQYAATQSECQSSTNNKQDSIRKNDRKKAGLGTAPRCEGDRQTTSANIWPTALLKNMQEKQARAKLSVTKKLQTPTVVARATTSTTTTSRDARRLTIQQQIARFNNLSTDSTTSTTRSQGTSLQCCRT